jgi:hypothetical protein
VPEGVILPIRSAPASVNAVIAPGGPPTQNSVTVPEGVILPIRSAPASVNQRLPSGPAVIAIPAEVIPAVNSVTVPEGVILPIERAGPAGSP